MSSGLRAHISGVRTVLVAVVALSLSVCKSTTLAQSPSAQSFGPSVAGRLYAWALDPERPNVIYAGGDVCGAYLSVDYGASWQLWSQGLESQEHTGSMFVADLLVIPSTLDDVQNSRVGVYAATIGGIYFRAFGDASWTLMTDHTVHPERYMYGRTDQPRKGLAIPFCALTLDESTGTLYAGAGNRVYLGRADSGPENYNAEFSYPALGQEFFNPAIGVGDQYTLWSLGVTANSPGPAEWLYDSSEMRPRGLARQIAILSTDASEAVQRHWVATGTSKGIWIKDDIVGTWQQIEDDSAKSVESLEWSGFVWGVASGTNGRLYALTRRLDDPNTGDPVLPAGVWYRDFVSPTDNKWHPVDNPSADVPPYDGQMEVAHHDFKWFISIDGWCDLTTITVRPGPVRDTDEIFVGGHSSVISGYFRYGNYESASGPVRGWIQFVYERPAPLPVGVDWWNMQYFSIDWNAQPIVRRDMYLPPVNKLGWLGNSAGGIHSNVAVKYDEGMANIIVDLYHCPIRSADSGSTWNQIYCDGNESGWTGRGLNLDTTTDIEFDSSGQMLLATLDNGVFVGDENGSAFRHWNKVRPWNPSFTDVEICTTEAGDEVYGILRGWFNDTEYHLARHNPDPQVAGTAAEWEIFYEGGANAQFTDIAFYGRDQLYLTTKSTGSTNGLLLFTRDQDGQFANPQDPGAAVGADMFSVVNVPGSSFMLCGGNDRLTCFDANAPANGRAWLTSASGSDEIRRASKRIRKVWVDRLGRVAYVGTSGACEAGDSGPGGAIGTVLRFDGPFSLTATPVPTMLANSSATDHPFGFTIPMTGFPAHDDQPNERYTYARCFETDPNNPKRVYVGLGVPAVLYQGNMHTKNGVWLYDPALAEAPGGPWSQVVGGQSSPSRGVNRQVLDLAARPGDVDLPGAGTGTLFVGTDGQGPFRIPVDVTTPPIIAAAAAYPLLADASGAAHAIGVHVTPAPNTTIETVTVDMRPWGGGANEPLLDDGVAPDLADGDGIFTSQLLSADFGAPGAISVTAFAQASGGGYASRAVALEILENPISENAVYRFRAGSTDASHVLAVAIATPPSWDHVTANLAAVNGPTSIALEDDGLGEDVKAGDGVFTSQRFAASMPNIGSYSASVTATPLVGGSLTQAVNMAAVTQAAKFTNDAGLDETERLGDALALGLAARPYSSIYFRARPNEDQSRSVMITTFDDNATPPGIWGRALQFDGSEGRFESRAVGSSPSWLTEPLPEGSRGVTYADFDNDGDTDFFICNPTVGGKLFVNYLNDTSCPAAWQGKFVNRTSAICGPDSVYLDGALAASWGDYTGDGFVDLFVSTGSYTAPIDEIDELPMLAQSGMNGGDLRLFRNTMGSTLRKSLVWGSSSGAVCLAGCWVDLDNDGDLDHVSTRYVDGGVGVLENHGINAAHTDQVMESATWSIAEPFYGGNSVTVIDYDHDPYPDLLVTEVASGHLQARVLRNRYGSAQSREFESTVFAAGGAWNGAIVADLNLDGQDDFVLLPRSADVVPALFMSNGYILTPVFEEPWPAVQLTAGAMTPVYRDLGYTLGVRDGRTGGGFAADLDGDHAPDLFLGREMVDSQGQSSGEQCLYRSTGTAGVDNHWLQVNLRTRGDSNGSLIGTRVQVVANGKQWLKSIDGGSFRGGQGSNDLLFGLGGETSIDYVKVVFPSGDTRIINAPDVVVDTPLTVWEEQMNVPTNQSSSYELQPGFVDCVFRWKTGSIKGDLRSDKVVVWPYGQPESDPANQHVLEFGTPSVSHLVYKDKGAWIHELRWGGVPCDIGLRWSFRATSGAGANVTPLTATQSANTASVTYCLPENYGQ